MAINVKCWAFVGVVSLLLGGCSTSVTGGNSGGSGGMGGNDAGGMGGMGGMGSGGQGTGGTAASGGSSGSVCGGFSGQQCADTEYCDYPNDICGAADGQGVCRARPQACDLVYDPVCACDGMVYGNDCEAATKGFDTSDLGGCMPPMANQFNCGHTFCDSATQYCLRTYADVANTPDSYICRDLPASCSGMPASCACIGDPCGAPIAAECMPIGNGFRVSCPGG
jgi:hypothetical protein